MIVGGFNLSALLRGCSWVRLALAAVLLGAGALSPATVTPGLQPSLLTFLFLAVATCAGAGLLPWVAGKSRRTVWLVCVLDVVLITAVVAATGIGRSLFSSMYVMSIIAACMLLPGRGGLIVASTAGGLYVSVVMGRTVMPVLAFVETPATTTALEVLTILLHAGTFLFVAIAVSALAERIRAASRELESQRKDLGNLQAFRDVIFDSVEAGLVALDRRQTITAFNHAAEEIVGVPTPQAIGRLWSTVFGPAVSVSAVEAALADAPRTPPRHELDLRRPDGSVVPVRLSFSPLRAADGTRLGILVVVENLSSLREMEARVRHADRLAMLGRLAANIADEIRNPIASLTGAIEALTSRAVPESERERLVQIVLRESDRLNEIIKNFLEYARPAPLSITSVDVGEALDDILLLLEHRALPPGLKIVRDFPRALRWPIDAQQFRQAVWNLCLNAVDAMPEGGELRVSATVRGGRMEVQVADTGEGIAPDELGQLFEPFFSTKPDGSGLGLALVHRIVHDHDGEIDLRSEPGTGTTFTLSLPGREA
ncbi:MAG: PAS domain S-box protein [Candidatus Rokubacteria bacterium]|nr:PAS domain S-box protein [Candidatus Rokubacteria bacterium]